MSTETFSVEVRFANLADSTAVADVINAAFSVERFFVQGNRITVAGVESLMERGRFLVAEASGAMVGCVYLEPMGERAYLGLLSVDPSRQKLGLGRRLMEEAENQARSDGCKFVDLKIVNLRTELLPFYGSLGYDETGTQAFPEEVSTSMPCHFILMSKSVA
ncbi:MAG: GNAT family N-acetyltransferase [Blastocatellia bacterium]